MSKTKSDLLFDVDKETLNLIETLLEPNLPAIEHLLDSPLHETLHTTALRRKFLLNADNLPPEVYKIIATIVEFKHEVYREKIIEILNDNKVIVSHNNTCEYLVATILLHCPHEVARLEILKNNRRRRRFFVFVSDQKIDKPLSADELSKIFENIAKTIANEQTNLADSVSISADNIHGTNGCQFMINLCDKVVSAHVFNNESKCDENLRLSALNKMLVRLFQEDSRIEINVESKTIAKQFVQLFEREIFGSEHEHHFKEEKQYDLAVLKTNMSEILQLNSPDVAKIVLNMIEVTKYNKRCPVRYGSASITSDIYEYSQEIRDSDNVLQACFTVELCNRAQIKFTIDAPFKLTVNAQHRPFICELVRTMGLATA